MKFQVSWDVMLCRWVNISRRFDASHTFSSHICIRALVTSGYIHPTTQRKVPEDLKSLCSKCNGHIRVKHTTKIRFQNTVFLTRSVAAIHLSFLFSALCIENLLLFDVRNCVYELSNFTERSPVTLRSFFQGRCRYAECILSMVDEGIRTWGFGGMRTVVILLPDNIMC